MIRFLTLAISILTGFFSFYTARAQSVSLDTTFGNDGRVVTDLGGFDVSFGMAVQPDDKILVCGASSSNPEKIIVLRYLTNGQLDPSFGDGGKAGISLGSSGGVAFALALQSDGKIVITGEVSDSTNAGSSDIFLARFKMDGSIDSSFGVAGGTRIWSDGWNEEGLAIAVQPSGKIVITGHQDENNQSFLVVFRFDTHGILDNSFGQNGRFIHTDAYTGTSISLDKNGNFWVVGQTPGAESTTAIAFKEDGSLELGFGNNGISSLDVIPGNDKPERAFSSFIQTDGTLIIGGDFAGFSAARIMSNGLLDQSFGVSGVCKASFPNNQYFIVQGSFCLPQPDGKILVTGLLIDGNNDDFGIVRFDKNGNFDHSFGTEGWVTTDITGTQDWCYASAFQSNNKLLLSGYSIGNQKIDISLARYTLAIDSAPPPDTGQVAEPAPKIFPNPSFGDLTLEYSIRSSSKISVDVFDATGRLTWVVPPEVDDVIGLKTKPLDISELADGFYILRLRIEEGYWYLPFIKQQ